MDYLILKEYIKWRGEAPSKLSPGFRKIWSNGFEAFTIGWHACSEWEQELLETEKDVLYQQEGLTRGE